MGLSATFCVVTDFVDTQRPLWDWEIMCRICYGPNDVQLAIGSSELRRLPNESRSTFAIRVIESLKQCSLSELQRALEITRAQSATREIDELMIEAEPMSWEQLGILKENKMEIGSHSGSHRSLARIPLTEAITEISRSKKQIENHLQSPCVHFAFPFGTVRDHNPTLISAVKDSGFRTCLLARHGVNVLSPKVFCMNRIDMYEDTDAKHLLG